MPRFFDHQVLADTRSPVIGTAAALLIMFVIIVVVGVHWHISQRTEATIDALIQETAVAFEEVPPFTNADASALRQFPNRVHVERAQQLGIPRIPDRQTAEEMLAAEGLVRLEPNQYYLTIDLGYSIPYVVEDAANLLDIIGERFHQLLREHGLPLYRFIVTSATRTNADQVRLRRVNSNAAENSSHFHATTVDVHYGRFNYDVTFDSLPDGPALFRPRIEQALQEHYEAMAEEHQPKLKSILGQAMRDVQAEDLVMVTYERMQPVYHITVNQRIRSRDVEEEAQYLTQADPVDDEMAIDVQTVAPAR